MPKKPPTLLPSQKAALSEASVATAIHLQTNGHVHIARPRPDDHGVDLRAYIPGARATLDIQVKAAFTAGAGRSYQFHVDAQAIPRDASRYLVVCVLGTDRLPGLAEPTWLIPGSVIKRRAKGRPSHVFSVSPYGPRPSQWDKYQAPLADLGKAVLARLEAAEGRPVPRRKGGISPRARGVIIEDAVTFELIMGSKGRLTVFRPFADTAGLDFEVLSLDSCVSTAAQLKGTFMESTDEKVTVLVPEDTFRPRGDRYVVVAPYVPREMRLAPTVWVVRADVFGRLAPRTRKKLVFSSSPGSRTRNRWAPYRYAPGELAGVFEKAIAVCAVGQVTELPDTGRGIGQRSPGRGL